MRTHLVLPGDVDDSSAVSGGNVYGRRARDGLRALGVDVRATPVPGAWPRPGEHERAQLAATLAGVPDDDVVLLDGLVACAAPEVVVPHADRLRLAVLVHLPLAEETGLDAATAARLDAAERACLHAVRAVVATGTAASERLARRHGLAGVHTVPPGTDPAPLASGTDGTSALLCVASVTPRKGHDVLLTALAELTDASWSCTCVGPVRDRAQLARMQRLVHEHRLDDRVTFPGPLTGAALAQAYAATDLFLLPSRAETYGMVVAEALARGIPVIGSEVPDAIGDGGLLIPADDVAALAAALRRWFSDEKWRSALRTSARERRDQLPTWDTSTRALAEILAGLRG